MGDQQSWTGEPEVVMMQISDFLAAEFAIGGDAPLRTVHLNISGISTIEVFGNVQNVLNGMNIIDNFAIMTVAGDRISFRVNAHGGAERLARALRFEGFIEEERIDNDFGIDEPVSELNFFYNP